MPSRTAVALLIGIAWAAAARADIPAARTMALIDMSSRAGGRVVPVFAVDAEIVARLLYVARYGKQWDAHPVDAEAARRALWTAAQLVVLAYSGTDEGTASRTDTQAVREWLAATGGPDTAQRIAAQCATGIQRVTHWLDMLAAAGAQLVFLKHQVDAIAPKELRRRFARAPHPFSGKPFSQVSQAFLEFSIRRDLQVHYERWLQDALSRIAIFYAR